MKERVLRLVGLMMSIVLMVTLLAACGGGGGDASPTPTTSSPPASSAPADDRVFDVDINVTLGEPVSPSWAQLFRDLETRSDGRLKVTVHWSQGLLTIPEIPRGVGTGQAQFSNLPTPNYPDTLPLNCRILQLPFMGLREPNESAEIWMQLYDEFDEMKEEMAEFNIMAIAATTLGVYDLHFIDKNPVRVPADLSGRQIVPYSTEFLPVLQKYNAAGTYIPPGQIYESLERAVVDGYVNNWAFKGWFGLSDLINQSVKLSDYGAFQEFNVLILNLDFYNGLPADLQQLWIDMFRTERGYAKMWQDTADLVANEIAKAEEKGNLFIDLTPSERQLWVDEFADSHENAIAEINEQRGDTVATDIYNRAREIIDQKYGS